MALLHLLLPPKTRAMDRSSTKRYEMIIWGWRRHRMIAVSEKQLNTAAIDHDMHELYAQYLPKGPPVTCMHADAMHAHSRFCHEIL